MRYYKKFASLPFVFRIVLLFFATGISTVAQAQSLSALTISPKAGAILLNWSYSGSYSQIQVKRATQSGGPYTIIAYNPLTPDAYLDRSANPGSTYYYQVTVLSGSTTYNSNEVSGAALPVPIPLLSMTGVGNSRVNMSWQQALPYCYFMVKRATNAGGPYTTIGYVPTQSGSGSTTVRASTGTVTYTDTTAQNGTTYYYTVEGRYFPIWSSVGVNYPITISPSNEISATPSAGPIGLTGNFVANVHLSWNGHLDAVSYNVKRSLTPRGPYQTLTTTASKSYTDTNIVRTTYYYVVTLNLTGGGESPASNEVAINTTVTTSPGIPNAVTVQGTTASTVQLLLPPSPDVATDLMLERLVDTSGGNPLPPTTGMIGWYRADDLTAPNNSLVGSWPDASGAGNHGAQGNHLLQPTLIANGVNGRPVVRFSGTGAGTGYGDYFLLPGGMRDFTAGLSAFVVAKPSGATGSSSFFDFGNPGEVNSIYFGTTPGTARYKVFKSNILGGQIDGSGITSGAFQIIGVVQQGGVTQTPSTAVVYRNGAAMGSGSVIVPVISERSTNYIGIGYSYQSLHPPFDGDISEILIYNTALSNSQRQQVEEYLSRKYSIGAVNAPAGTWTTIGTNLSGGTTFTDSGLSPNTTYWYRCRGISGANISDPGPVEMAVTLPAAPDAPGAPTFGTAAGYSIPIIAPALPARATHLRLQKKLPDNSFVDIADHLNAGATTLARDLRPGMSFTFRYVAVGRGGETVGPEASSNTASTDPTGNGTGLRGYYFGLTSEFKNPVLIRLDPTINFQWGNAAPDPAVPLPFITRWLGQIEAQVTGTHTIYFAGEYWDDVKLWVGGQQLINYNGGLPVEQSGTIALTAGQKYDIKIEFVNHAGVAKAELRWECAGSGLTKQIIPQSQLYPALVPEAPGAPIFEEVGSTSVVVVQPTWPTNANTMDLQMRLTSEPDFTFHDVASALIPGEKSTIRGLLAGRQYTFRYVAEGIGGTIPGTPADVWLRPLLPSPPGPPTFLNVGATTVDIKAPVLPPDAGSLTLQKSVGDTSNYADVVTDLAGEAETTVTGLTLGTTYYFRYVAVGHYGATEGEGKPITTITPPPVPPAPVFSSVGSHNAFVEAIAPPAGAQDLYLERKISGQPDSTYATVNIYFSSSSTGTREVTGLTPATTYTFRFVTTKNTSISFFKSRTPGPTTEITTTSVAPVAPGPPQFSNVARTTLTATTPALPARAVSLTLQSKLAADPDTAYADVATGLGSETATDVTGLTAGTSYHFRCIAVNAEGSTIGAVAGVTTGDAPPDVPGAPTFSTPVFSSVLTASVVVTPPPFPALTTWMKLEVKDAGQPDSEYQVVGDQIVANQTTTVHGLYAGQTYTFRYVALGLGGITPGTPANLTIAGLTTLWQAGTPINCEGIILPAGNGAVDSDEEVPFSSAAANDMDLRVLQVGGLTVSSMKLADPCTYTWSAVDNLGDPAGTFKNNRAKGQSVIWVAPNVPGTYTITLTVDDQNTLNKAAADSGTRNDDPALVFTKTVTVQ